MRKITLEIDNKIVEVEEGTTILRAVEKLNIKIPTLCSHKALLPYGACRLCLVEISSKSGPVSLQAACTYPAQEGLIVQTDTPKVIKTRKIMMELLLARCPDSQPIKNLAKEMGVERTRIKPKNKDCILCGLCVRMCEERMGRSAINFVGRGKDRKVESPFGEPNEVCQACGACDFICPTNKIILTGASPTKPRPIPFEFNIGLIQRPAVYIPYPQAVPNIPVIDKRFCVHLISGKCGICQGVCEADAIDYEQKEESININVGAIVATGGVELFDANLKKEYGYDRYENVLTSIQLERILSSSGPTKGEVHRPSDGKSPQSIAFIQCVGSRDPSLGNEFCSAVCCMYSLKEAVISCEHDPNIKATIFYIDIRSFGKDYERYYEEANQNQQIEFIRCMISKIYETPKSKNLIVRYIDGKDGKIKEKEFEMVVLAVGLTDTFSLKQLAKTLGIKTNDYGFIETESDKPCITSQPGIFVAGTFSEPKDIPESVADGSSSAACVSSLLKESRHSLVVKKEYPREKDVSDEDVRIGVFVCRCGRNIASVVDVPSVVEYASHLQGVVHTREFLYTCSQDALCSIKDDIKKYNLNRIVIASCTPRTHEELFRDTIREAGLNRYLFEMTSLREQVSWVHKDKPFEATEKSNELVKMMTAKALLFKPLESQLSPVNPSALVIGGGAAGMHAAFFIAEQGFRVYLVEKEEELGGNLRHLYYNLNYPDVQKFLRNIKEKVSNHQQITVFTNAKLLSMSGFSGNFSSTIKFNSQEKEIKHGAVIVATGANQYKPKQGEYGYGESPYIISQVDLEEMIIKGIPSLRHPQTFVMIQCVGSRNDEHPYCSRICCTHAIKNSLKLKELNSDHRIYVLYRDIRTYGFLEKYYLWARGLGVIFSCFEKENQPRVTVNPVRESPSLNTAADSAFRLPLPSEGNGSLSKSASFSNGVNNNKIIVTTQDNLIKESLKISCDWVILSTGITPCDNQELVRILKVPLNRDGFFLEAHPKIRPLDFTTEGMFLCGLAHSPRSLQESLVQAQGAAARAITLLCKDKIEAKAITACVNERLCKGCGLCISACPYGAREMDEEKGVAKVIEVLCQGCGACTVACPSGASTHKGFSKKQILSMVEAVIK